MFRFTLRVGPQGKYGIVNVQTHTGAELTAWFTQIFSALDPEQRVGSHLLLDMPGQLLELPWSALSSSPLVEQAPDGAGSGLCEDEQRGPHL